jgi:3-hydroxyacyl-[acyl-carrier-protein] dehydratase
MRLLDEISELVPGERARGRRTLRPDDFFFDGHFPGEPIVPAVMLVEMIAQLGGVAAGAPRDACAPGEPLRLRVAAFGPFKFPAAARPGAVLDVEARVSGALGGLYKIEGRVTDGSQVLAVGSVTLGAAGAPRAAAG